MIRSRKRARIRNVGRGGEEGTGRSVIASCRSPEEAAGIRRPGTWDDRQADSIGPGAGEVEVGERLDEDAVRGGRKNLTKGLGGGGVEEGENCNVSQQISGRT